MEPLTVFTTVAGVVAGVIAGWLGFLLKKQGQEHARQLAQQKQDHARELGDRKQVQQERMELLPVYESVIRDLKRDHAECMKKHSEAIERSAQNEAKLAGLQEVVKNLQAEENLKMKMMQMEMYFHQRFHDMLDGFAVVANRVAEGNLILHKITEGTFALKTIPSSESTEVGTVQKKENKNSTGDSHGQSRK